MLTERSRHRASQGSSAARIGSHLKYARGSESSRAAEPPGVVRAEIQPGDGPFQECGVVSTSPPPWLEAGDSSVRRDWCLLIGSFGGTMRESHRSHPKPYDRDPTERRAPSPVRRHRAVHSFGPNCRRSAADRAEAVKPRPPRQPRCPTRCLPLVVLPAPGPLAGRFPRDTVPIHPRAKGCQGIIGLFRTETAKARLSLDAGTRDSPPRNKEHKEEQR